MTNSTENRTKTLYISRIYPTFSVVLFLFHSLFVLVYNKICINSLYKATYREKIDIDTHKYKIGLNIFSNFLAIDIFFYFFLDSKASFMESNARLKQWMKEKSIKKKIEKKNYIFEPFPIKVFHEYRNPPETISLSVRICKFTVAKGTKRKEQKMRREKINAMKDIDFLWNFCWDSASWKMFVCNEHQWSGIRDYIRSAEKWQLLRSGTQYRAIWDKKITQRNCE